MSFGDPDLSSKSDFYRKFQSFARLYDRFIFKDHDIPGITFASPVEWAPWMETIWFGNYYDYRSAFFHDVMYSNSQPGKEGALLHRDPATSEQLAMLYQRYKKFDEISYSVSNGTFFNLFAADNLRLGRYKVILPDSNELILCSSDPLTYSDLRRYVNSFSPLKWFKAKFIQQKRKRQTVLQLSLPVNSRRCDLFAQCVHFIEFGAALELMQDGNDKGRAAVVTVPILPLPSYLAQYDSDSNSTSNSYDGLVLSRLRCNEKSHPLFTTCSWPTAVVNSQYFLDNLWTQLVLEMKRSSSSMKVLLGGDGRLFNDFGLDRLLNVNQAINSVADSNSKLELVLSSKGKLTIEQAITAIQARQVQAAIILTVGEVPVNAKQQLDSPVPSTSDEEREEIFSSEGGLGGRWGYTVLYRDNASENKEIQSWGSEQFLSVAEAMTKAEYATIMLSRHDDSILDMMYTVD